MIVNTPQGEIRLLQPEPARLRHLRALLPFGAVQFGEPINDARYGLVMKCGEKEVFAVKQQPADIPEDWAEEQFSLNSILLTESLHRYLEHGYSGLMLPCAYWRKKDENGEVGFAYFASPAPGGIESNEFEFQPAFDQSFGHGATQMLTSFFQALKDSAAETGLTMQPTIGLDIRPRLALGTLGFSFLVFGRDVFALRTAVSEEDPAWTILKSTGIEEVYHLPAVPMEISEEQLELAKPEAKEGSEG